MMNISLKRAPFSPNWVIRAWATVALFGAAVLFCDAASAGTLATNPNSLLFGMTSYHLADYENLYDAEGNVVTNRPAQAGDTLQGVYVIDSVANSDPSSGTKAVYSPDTGGVELTGVFDEYVAGIDSAGNYIVTPDNTTTTSGGTNGKTISGSAFQSTYGTNAMIAEYYNNIDAMPLGTQGNGLVGLTTAQAFALAKTGSEWASFGAKNTTGGTSGWGASNGYFWAFNQTGPGLADFSASLDMIQNDTAYAKSMYGPVFQVPPGNGTDTSIAGNPPGLFNIFGIQGTTNPTSSDLAGTAFTVFSTDPAHLNLVPEPSSLALAGVSFGGFLFMLRRARRRLGH